MSEIEGTFNISPKTLKCPTRNFPSYIPKIHNGSSRSRVLRWPMAAIPVRELLMKNDNNWSCRFNTTAQVHQHFHLSKQTPFLISCISHDGDIELVWDEMKFGQFASKVAKLKPAAIIAPNFSFFIEDVPRTHTLYNRKRIYLASRILSDAGCPVIIPLSALTPNDWDFWYAFLQENPLMTYVAKEFQTGLSKFPAATSVIEQLAKLQRRLGRPLHPVAVAGAQFSELLKSHFNEYTILDSRSFITAMKRQRFVEDSSGALREENSPTIPGEPTDELLKHNIRARSRILRMWSGN